MRVKKSNLMQKDDNQKEIKEKIQKTNMVNTKDNEIYKMNSYRDRKKDSNENTLQIISSEESKRRNKYNKNIIFNNNKNIIRKNLSYISLNGNTSLSKNKLKVERAPHIVYNKLQHRSPTKNDYKIYSIQQTIIKDDESLNDDNLIKKKFIYLNNSPSFPYLTKSAYQLVPQKAINIEFIQKDYLVYNHNKNTYYNNNFYKINNTQSNFYIERENRPSNYYKKEIKKNYIRGINPQSEYNIQNNDNNNIYNKTINNFYMHRPIVKSNYNKNSKTINNSINKYDNLTETKMGYSNENNNVNKKKINTSRINSPDDDYSDNSNLYREDFFNSNFYEEQKMRKELTDLDIKKNNYKHYLDNNTREHLLRKLKSKTIMQDISNNNINDNKVFLNKNKSNYMNNSITPKNSENGIMDEIDANKVLIKKRPLLNEYTKKKYKTAQKDNLNKSFDICQNICINYENMSNKIIFDNEESIIDYVNKKYKEEKKRAYFRRKIKFTGYILSKKFKGKTLYDIEIEDDINKINQKLIDENVEIKNELIQVCYLNKIQKNNDDEIEKIKNLEEQMLKYKEENESLCKKDNMKNDLIKKLDNEKQNLIEEIKNISNKIEKVKELNITLNEEYQQLKVKYKKHLNKIDIKNYVIDNILSFLCENEKIREFKDNKLKEEKVEIFYIIKNNDNSNILSINNNMSNGDIGNDSKKHNLFRLSKISEIKENKIDNIDSKDTVIKNNIEIINDKLNYENNSNGNNDDE